MIVWVAGVGRSAAVLQARVAGIGDPADNAFWSLPGHGDEPFIPEIGLRSWANALAGFIRRIPRPEREVHVIGESLGGTVALALAGLVPQLRSIVLVDAPLTMAKQWALQAHLQVIGQRENPRNDLFYAMIEALFGILPSGGQAERNYYPLLDGLRGLPLRACAFCSDLPLWPCTNRPLDPLPSTNDEIDHYQLRRAGVEVRLISGPHNLLDVSTEACKSAIQEWLAA